MEYEKKNLFNTKKFLIGVGTLKRYESLSVY